MNMGKVRMYYLSFNLYNFSAGLIAVFLNLFVLATASLLGVIYFNIVYFAGLEIFYFASVYALDYLDPKDLYIIGSVIRAITLILIMIAALFVSNILVFGFAYGASIGTFWLGNNILVSDVSKEIDRKDFVLKLSVIGDAVSIIAPIAAGIMIQYSQFAGPLRFAYDFVAGAIVLGASAYTLSIVKFPKEQKAVKFRLGNSALKHESYGHFKIYFFLNQICTIPFSIILPIYVFLVTNSYVITGIYGSMILLLSLFANYLTKISPSKWDAFLKLGIVASILSSILLFFPSYINGLAAVFIFTIIYTIFSTPLQNQAYSNFIEMIDKSKINRIHFWINREYYITAGRAVLFTVMALVLIYSQSSILYSIYLIPVFTLSILACLKSSTKRN